MQRSALCRARRELSNAYLLAKIGVDTAENEPCKVCPLSVSLAIPQVRDGLRAGEPGERAHQEPPGLHGPARQRDQDAAERHRDGLLLCFF